MNIGKHGHACGIVKDSIDESKTIVITAGGRAGSDFIKFTEIFVLGSDHWKLGPDLDHRINDAFGITTPNGKSFLSIGGWNKDKFKYDEAIYKLDCHNLECSWSKVTLRKLGVGRSAFLAAFVPSSLLSCN